MTNRKLVGPLIWFLFFPLLVLFCLLFGKSPEVQVWWQLITGNWPRNVDEVLGNSPIKIPIAMIIRFTLTIGAILAVLIKLWENATKLAALEKDINMNWIKMMRYRDALIISAMSGKTEIADREMIENRLEAAIESANQHFFEEQLPILVSDDFQRKELMEQLERNITR